MNTSFPGRGPRGISLRSILPQATPLRATDLSIRACCNDWSECQPGDLYVAVQGPEADGHDFVDQAVARGACGVVTERLLAVDIPQFLVEDSRRALGKICQALAGNPSQHLATIGVAGTDGKTVTSQLIAAVLNEAGEAAWVNNSLRGRRLSTASPANGSTNVGSTRVRRWTCAGLAQELSHAAQEDFRHAVIEVDTEALATHQLQGLQFDLMVVTNIRRDESREGRPDATYLALQSRALEYLKPQGLAILNADDPHSYRLLDTLQVPALTIGIHQAAEVSAKILEQTESDQTFLIQAGQESMAVCTRMLGPHHIYNCLAAAAVGLSLGMELPTIVRGLESVTTLPGRLEELGCSPEFPVFVDSAQRPSAVATAVHAVRQHRAGKLWVVASVTPDQSPSARRRLGEILERGADEVVLTLLEDARHIDYEPFHQLWDGCQRPESLRVIPNRCRAIEWVLDQAHKGDAVLILGGGEQPVMESASLARPVTDRRICESWLYDRRSCLPSPRKGFAAASPQPVIYSLAQFRNQPPA